MPRNMTIVKEVSGTELVNAYFTMVRSDIGKSVASLRVRDKKVFAETCDNLSSSVFSAVTAMRAYNSGEDIKDGKVKLAQMRLAKAAIVNRMDRDIRELAESLGEDE